jgi:hypothetical protein
MSYEDNFSQPGSLRSSDASSFVKPSNDSSENTVTDNHDLVKRSYAYEDNSSLASSDYVPDDETAQKLSTGQFSETSSEYSSSSYKLNDYETDGKDYFLELLFILKKRNGSKILFCF